MLEKSTKNYKKSANNEINANKPVNQQNVKNNPIPENQLEIVENGAKDEMFKKKVFDDCDEEKPKEIRSEPKKLSTKKNNFDDFKFPTKDVFKDSLPLRNSEMVNMVGEPLVTEGQNSKAGHKNKHNDDIDIKEKDGQKRKRSNSKGKKNKKDDDRAGEDPPIHIMKMEDIGINMDDSKKEKKNEKKRSKSKGKNKEKGEKNDKGRSKSKGRKDKEETKKKKKNKGDLGDDELKKAKKDNQKMKIVKKKTKVEEGKYGDSDD